MSRLMLSAALCAAILLLASEAAVAAPCGITAATIGDASPYKPKPAVGDFMTDRTLRRGATKNVGQEVTLLTLLTGTPNGTPSYRWFVEGEVIDDYTESPAEDPPGTAAPFAVRDHAEVTEGGKAGAVFTDPRITFYWRMQGVDLPADVTVTLLVSEAGADTTPCATATRSYRVERNQDSPESQPEDYYVEINHAQRVLDEHGAWHASHRRPPAGTAYMHGALFANFHTAFLGNYAAFRRTFGYPATGLYIPDLDIDDDENGYTLEHVRRFGDRGMLKRPLWTTRAGGPPRAWGMVKCPSDPGGQESVADFDGDLSVFGCAVENEWHNPIHGQLAGVSGGQSGDMGSFLTAPKDPIFWRWHGFVDNVFEGFRAATSNLAHAHAAQAGGGTKCHGLRATIVGTAGRDVLRGTRRRDVIVGGRGADLLHGLRGDDVLCGGPGRDRLLGGRGNDVLDGARGRDNLRGGTGADQMAGGAGRDRLLGQGGSDQLSAGAGNDVADGGPGNEWVIQGDGGNDRLRGAGGADALYGGGGRDRISGGGGDDALDGGAGNDALDGGGGDDAAIYLLAPGPVDVNLGTGAASGYGSDRLDDLERVDGSRFADQLVGSEGSDELNGHDGGDTLSGGGGTDVVDGGDGTDTTAAGSGEDICMSEETGSGCED